MKYEYFDMMKEMYKYIIIIVCKKKRKKEACNNHDSMHY